MTAVDIPVSFTGSRPRRPGIGPAGPALLPLDAGQQYRFGFDMGACIGCHSCEVACAEQNGNPVGVNWRRVGEVEGGEFPTTQRLNLSMACNHCLEPACLTGCPTNAYVKLANGIVAHHAEDCIGCQYCIWNCPYEVPVFNSQRRVVTKCDLCQPRLAAGGQPACVEACPTRAITVEKVDVAAWRADHREADAPGLPSSDLTLSTTRIERPESLHAATRSVVADRLDPAEPHWPLVAVTLLTQLALGTVVATLILPHHGRAAGAATAAGVGALALAVSVLHLGRPAAAWKAARNVRRSWLSREVVLFSAFAAATFAYAATALVAPPGPDAVLFGAAAALAGAAGVYASGRLYLVPARPVWNSARTVVSFFATAAATGPLLALAAIHPDPGDARLLFALAGAGGLLQLGTLGNLAAALGTRPEREFTLSARLLTGPFRAWAELRMGAALASTAACLWAAGAAGPSGHAGLGAPALIVAGAGELVGRYLFFVTVTPMTAARRFSAGTAAPTGSRTAP